MEPSQDQSEKILKLSDKLALVLLVVQGLVLLLASPILIQCYVVTTDPNAGDAAIGGVYFSMLMIPIGLVAALISLPFAIAAKQLHIGLRFLLVLLPFSISVLGFNLLLS